MERLNYGKFTIVIDTDNSTYHLEINSKIHGEALMKIKSKYKVLFDSLHNCGLTPAR